MCGDGNRKDQPGEEKMEGVNAGRDDWDWVVTWGGDVVT